MHILVNIPSYTITFTAYLILDVQYLPNTRSAILVLTSTDVFLAVFLNKSFHHYSSLVKIKLNKISLIASLQTCGLITVEEGATVFLYD